MILEYNKYMNCVDRQDEMLVCYIASYKTIQNYSQKCLGKIGPCLEKVCFLKFHQNHDLFIIISTT